MASAYPGRVRFLVSGLLAAVLSNSATPPVYPQATLQAGTVPAQAGAASKKAQFFTGMVTAIAEDKLTVNRNALGKNSSTKTFILTAETKFEGGKPRVRSQVTVRYVTSEEGDRAVHVILRRAAK